MTARRKRMLQMMYMKTLTDQMIFMPMSSSAAAPNTSLMFSLMNAWKKSKMRAMNRYLYAISHSCGTLWPQNSPVMMLTLDTFSIGQLSFLSVSCTHPTLLVRFQGIEAIMQGAATHHAGAERGRLPLHRDNALVGDSERPHAVAAAAAQHLPPDIQPPTSEPSRRHEQDFGRGLPGRRASRPLMERDLLSREALERGDALILGQLVHVLLVLILGQLRGNELDPAVAHDAKEDDEDRP
eukprot:3055885-Rhodomonas_salina.3